MRGRNSSNGIRRIMPAAWAAGFAFLCCAAAHARGGLEERVGFLECGSTRITARAMCHGSTSLCVTQTLTFSGANARATLAPHPHKSGHLLSGRKIEALDYHAASWACTAGKESGRYLVIGLRRAGEAACAECDYEQIYNLNGRLLVSGMTVAAGGKVRENRQGRLFILKIKSGLHPKQFRPIYGR